MTSRMNSNLVRFHIDPEASVQLLTGPDGMPIVLIQRGHERTAFLNNCEDEILPLNTDNTPPALNARGELVCMQHFARFDPCLGCLIDPGKAHHVNRLENGLVPIRVINAGDQPTDNAIELEFTPELASKWQWVQAIRFRKGFGRGPLGLCRYLVARLMGRSPENSRV